MHNVIVPMVLDDDVHAPVPLVADPKQPCSGDDDVTRPILTPDLEFEILSSTFNITTESEDEMILGGFITTANRDRHGDIVDPDGVDTAQLQVLLIALWADPYPTGKEPLEVGR